MGYAEDRRWSDRFLPEIKEIIGPHLLTESLFEMDTKMATDLIVLRAKNIDIACRIRRPGYSERYPNQFTIRSSRDSGVKTELEKIINGFGDWMFYGHSDHKEIQVGLWYLIDLSAWRAHMIKNEEFIKKGVKSNGDGTKFCWFDLNSFPSNPPILIDSSIQINSINEPLIEKPELLPPGHGCSFAYKNNYGKKIQLSLFD